MGGFLWAPSAVTVDPQVPVLPRQRYTHTHRHLSPKTNRAIKIKGVLEKPHTHTHTPQPTPNDCHLI